MCLLLLQGLKAIRLSHCIFEAIKPEGWLDDELTVIADPDAEKPEEWDDEEDGDWIAPTIPNPKCEEAPGCGDWVRPTKPNPNYKGKWSAPPIDNPAYKGVWAPRKIKNRNYFVDKKPSNFHKIGGVGFEIWSMTEDILFDNIYVGHSKADAKALAAESFKIKQGIEKSAKEAEQAKEEATTEKTFKEDPLEWLRTQALSFIELAQIDPITAFKTKPETGIALIAVFLTFFGSVGALFGLIGGSRKPVKVCHSPGDSYICERPSFYETKADATNFFPTSSLPRRPSLQPSQQARLQLQLPPPLRRRRVLRSASEPHVFYVTLVAWWILGGRLHLLMSETCRRATVARWGASSIARHFLPALFRIIGTT